MARQTIHLSRTDAEQTQAWETGATAPCDELPPAVEPDAFTDGAADVCPRCGEPLSWHEQACAAPAAKEKAPAPPASAGFTFALGSLVLADAEARPYPATWRGQLKERHPLTGLVQRVPVYRLGDGHWDCYREEELRAA